MMCTISTLKYKYETLEDYNKINSGKKNQRYNLMVLMLFSYILSRVPVVIVKNEPTTPPPPQTHFVG